MHTEQQRTTLQSVFGASRSMLQDLITRCKNDDRRAQKELHARFFARMFSLCRRYVGNEEDALEVVNTGFLKMFTKLNKFEEDRSFEGWVKKIMINTALDFLRSTKSYRETISLNPIYHPTRTYNQGLSNLRMEELQAIIDSISPVSRMVFNLYVVDGYAHKEIAEQLKISIGTSKWHLSSARQQIRGQLEESYRELALAYG